MTIPTPSLSNPRHPPNRLTDSVEHVLVVRPHDLRWEVAHNGVTRPMIDWLYSRERAIEHAFEIARDLREGPGRTPVLIVVDDGDEGWEELLD